MRRIALTAILLGLVAGCATPGALRPAPGATTVPGRKDAAFAVVSDVRISVRGKWYAEPRDLQSVLTPVEVTIENRSGRPLRIAYGDFDLIGQSGFRYAAIPPLSTEGAKRRASAGDAGQAPVRPAVYAPGLAPLRVEEARFYVYAPGYADWRFGAWGDPWFWGDPFFYDRYWSAWQSPLPTRDMVQLALPEGVLDAGGTVSGYVYFNSVRREPVVTFVANVVDAQTGRSLGSARIPLKVKQ